jgi:hypothetical protein
MYIYWNKLAGLSTGLETFQASKHRAKFRQMLFFTKPSISKICKQKSLVFSPTVYEQTFPRLKAKLCRVARRYIFVPKVPISIWVYFGGLLEWKMFAPIPILWPFGLHMCVC